jgi:hypothetical protein
MRIFGVFIIGILSALSFAQTGPLQAVVTARGLQSLVYRGVEYADPAGSGVVGFSGEPAGIHDARKNKEPFSTAPTATAVKDNTVTLTYPWGTLAVTYVVKGADLNVTAVLTNTSTIDIGWWRANLLQFNSRLVFDATGRTMGWVYQRDRFGGPGNPYAHWGFADPHVYWWNDDGTKIIFADLDPKWQTGVYRLKTAAGDRWVAAVSGNYDENGVKAVPAGSIDVAHIAIRFRGVLDDPLVIAADSYAAWGRSEPMQVNWTDRRPIGQFFVAESAKGWLKNPNGWFNDPNLDVTTDDGRADFARRMLERVDTAVAVLKDVGAQGVIWWDVEGARNPHPITYIGDPRVLDPKHPEHDKYAPELDTEVTYDGKKMPLIDACFAKFTDAGLKTGVTIRPQALTWKGTAPVQTWVNNPNDYTRPKATYARERWGCTIFYVDSVNEWFGCWWYNSILKEYPDVLLLPEWSRTRGFAGAAPFSYTKFTGWYHGAPPEVKACWPNAFICMSNVDLNSPAGREGAFHAVQQGNILLFNCWYMHEDVRRIKLIYQLAGTKHTPVAADQIVDCFSGKETKIALRASDEDKDAVRYTILESPRHGTVKLDANSGVAFYTSHDGYLGPDLFSFKATDASGLDSNRAVVTINLDEE